MLRLVKVESFMEIAFVSSVTLGEDEVLRASGIGVYVQALTRELAKRNIPVIQVTGSGKSGGGDSAPAAEKNTPEKNVKIYRISDKPVRSNSRFIFKLAFKMRSLKFGSDTIIHAQRPELLLPFIWFKHRNPRICTLHGSSYKSVALKHSGLYTAMYRRLESYCLKRAAGIIAVDNATRKEYIERYPNLINKITVIPIGIDLKKFKIMDKRSLRAHYDLPADAKVVLYAGRLEREKRLDALLRAYADLSKKYGRASSKLHLLIVGEGRLRAELEALASDLKLKNVHFTGAIPHDEIPEVMNCADVFVLCSAFEGSPTVVKEALACGVPVVATEVGSIPEVVEPGKSGELLPQKAPPEKISMKIYKILSAEKEQAFNAEACAEKVKKFGMKVITDKIVGIYHEVQ
ncbi:MAG: glycosyltransferase family 4 protein [Thermoplasmata archaeon]|nr:MAG: glycosyltransferase family 4 protein [Thermoplasmata archaeon]